MHNFLITLNHYILFNFMAAMYRRREGRREGGRETERKRELDRYITDTLYK